MTDPQSRLSANDIAERLAGGQALLPGGLLLGLDDMTIRVRSNSAALLENLQGYFSHIVIADTDADTDTVIDLHAFECAAPDLSLDYVDCRAKRAKPGARMPFSILLTGELSKRSAPAWYSCKAKITGLPPGHVWKTTIR